MVRGVGGWGEIGSGAGAVLGVVVLPWLVLVVLYVGFVPPKKYV